mmetsp:Transcript_12540/g.27043  ORF Transcript_12540/g.27043 Transcript_12540/m.27043 type:complete len:227 (+) Transcript_12540:160-840(+)|eukprot:CAMPEP_0202901512 /NCGR_PEP_ID=MMETSP1392-20130828/14294_1 /ASSEMBLY_ACC=CAM_ASM_000868 /TAXON_ID=225041 /ORGANISM="Chlamydomonas chlamydogama, Strain SAG 11-48b" /LENGTH=226 /DNA_ID=CAMNT_0049588079 /DNA_START=95 /DNA_END=775 /DNA_ORIENTATION=+
MQSLARISRAAALASGRVCRVQKLQLRAAATSADAPKVKIVGLCGSLRKGSVNTGMLHAAARNLPPNATLEIADLSGLPLYNDDLWQGRSDDSALPEAVRKMRAQIASADAVLFANCEYNLSISSVLKTALDWGSKNPNVFTGKAAAIMGAGGGAGTARASAHLRNICAFLDLHILNLKDEIQVNRFAPPIDKAFDPATGEVVDKAFEERIAKVVANLTAWAIKIK